MKRFASILAVTSCLVVSGTLASGIALPTDAIATAQASRSGSQRALNAVWRLPEVQKKAQDIQRLSNGRVRVKLAIDSTPTRTEPYYTIRVFEEHPDRIVTLYWFRVASPGGAIAVQDEIAGEYISLEQWRKR